MLDADRVRQSELRLHAWVAVWLAPRNLVAVFLGIILLNSIESFIPGLALSYRFFQHDSFTRILDPEELRYVLFFGVLASPALVVAYLRMPSLIADTFDGLDSNDVFRSFPCNESVTDANASRVFAECLSGQSLERRFVRKVEDCLSMPAWSALALGAVLVGAVWWQVRVIPDLTVTDYWWHVSRGYYWVVWLPATLLYFYLAAVTTLRAVVGAIGLGLLFHKFETVFQPMHSDGKGGLAPVSRFILIIALALFVAVLTSVVWGLPGILGGSPEAAVIPLLFSASYVVIAPAILFFPLWSARQSMRRAAERELGRIESEYTAVTRRIGDPLASPQSSERVAPLLQYQANLLRWRDVTLSRLGAWPIGLPAAILTGLSVLGWLLGTAGSIVTLLGLF
ncbi:MAG: hypothetical protein MUP15_03840 [Dehalococcoidia bacterium]|nr:hypothetical protein [Dehalococcoidia bacterium]